MDHQRQKAFQKLRPVCVNLSGVALKFRGNQVTAKDVLRALEEQHRVLENLGLHNQLNGKLAEYSFFPLTHVLKESQRLTPRCMEVAVQSITILISQGWRLELAPALGQQLLIFMSLLVSADPGKQNQPPGEELTYAAFKCIEMIARWLGRSPTGATIFQDQTAQNIVDQLAYLLIESISDASSDKVQVAATEALSEIYTVITNRVFLASLLPRTVSSLTKALRPSTQARRTRQVLVANLRLLQTILKRVLADDISYRDDQDQAEREALDKTWLKATAAQIKNALLQVCKLRNHDQQAVQKALFDLCISIIEECTKTLSESLPALLETSVIIAGKIDDGASSSTIEFLFSTRPDLVEILESSFYDWAQSLPRVMQNNDDKSKQLMLSRLNYSFNVLGKVLPDAENLTSILSTAVLKSIAAAIDTDSGKLIHVHDNQADQYISLIQPESNKVSVYDPVLFDHHSQVDSAQQLQKLVRSLQQHTLSGNLTRHVIDDISNFATDQKIAPVWLALQLLQTPESTFDVNDLFDFAASSSDVSFSRVHLIQDLYAQTKDILLQSSPHDRTSQSDVRLIALTLEIVNLQAQQLGLMYRTELYEALYPILALLSSSHSIIQSHAIVTLNRLATSCEYGSVSSLLIENADYLVNSIAWKLNTFNLSPEAPAVLNMIIRLVGAKIIPYLDDLIDSVFAALDSFHGYPQWVEMLFEVLKAMVDESVKNPQLSITDGREQPTHQRQSYRITNVDNILSSLQARKRRKIVTNRSNNVTNEVAPHRPWTNFQDDPNYKTDPTEGKDLETLLREAETADEENDLPAPKEPEDRDPTKPLSKSHDLLIKIAKATVPHMSSPSPKVRHTLLQLVGEISPLLSRHENTFLPLINAVWPGIVQRMFSNIVDFTLATDDQNPEGEMGYNVAAAADVMAGLCENAGDFMATRIEQIFSQLKTMHLKTWKEVEAGIARKTKQEISLKSANEDRSGRNISGVVDLQVVGNEANHNMSKSQADTATNAISSISRTSTGQIFTSLVRLLIAILGHVRLTEDRTDEIHTMLTPLIDYPGITGTAVTKALGNYDHDTLWISQCRKIIENEIERGVRAANNRVWHETQMPALDKADGKDEFALQPLLF